uniref:Uncharacterized protein n=1 Tax=Ralstonia solanacearum TaxID=305 RepID=A0A0S4U5Q9_RALSL|nr:protein of unknown function [Ralstonia solanacearum]
MQARHVGTWIHYRFLYVQARGNAHDRIGLPMRWRRHRHRLARGQHTLDRPASAGRPGPTAYEYNSDKSV